MNKWKDAGVNELKDTREQFGIPGIVFFRMLKKGKIADSKSMASLRDMSGIHI